MGLVFRPIELGVSLLLLLLLLRKTAVAVVVAAALRCGHERRRSRSTCNCCCCCCSSAVGVAGGLGGLAAPPRRGRRGGQRWRVERRRRTLVGRHSAQTNRGNFHIERCECRTTIDKNNLTPEIRHRLGRRAGADLIIGLFLPASGVCRKPR